MELLIVVLLLFFLFSRTKPTKLELSKEDILLLGKTIGKEISLNLRHIRPGEVSSQQEDFLLKIDESLIAPRASIDGMESKFKELAKEVEKEDTKLVDARERLIKMKGIKQ